MLPGFIERLEQRIVRGTGKMFDRTMKNPSLVPCKRLTADPAFK
jgi:hypothetical protein